MNRSAFRARVPARYRPALFFETIYSIGSGAYLSFMFLTPFALKSVVGGTALHLTIFGAMVGGSSLLSPLVTYLGGKISMRTLVVVPNLLIAALLFATAIPGGGPMLFTLVMGMTFVLRVFPRVAEMNMYRVNYPVTHRGSAVGWLRAVAAVSGLGITLFGYFWFAKFPKLHSVVWCLTSLVLIVAAYSYSRIPVKRKNVFLNETEQNPLAAFVAGVKAFLKDKQFVRYQFGFSIPGFANHMAMMLVVQVLADDVLGKRAVAGTLPHFISSTLIDSWKLTQQQALTVTVGMIVVVLPMVMTIASSPFWGRYVDRTSPMYARSVFNVFQFVSYAIYAYGGLTMQVWPFFVGTVLQAVGNGGSQINWLTGSLYFAPQDRISLYNAIHVGLTGFRGLVAPGIGLWLYQANGMNLGASIFLVAAGLSLIGAVIMLVQGIVDPGPRQAIELDEAEA